MDKKQIEELIEKFNNGATQIQLAAEYSKTPSAIAGILRRNKHLKKRSRAPRRPKIKNHPSRSIRKVPAKLEKSEITSKTIHSLNDEGCRWIDSFGNYCGSKIDRGTYCAEHAKIVYEKVKGRKTDTPKQSKFSGSWK